MSETVYADIRAALTAHLLLLPSLPDVAWENSSFIPTPESIYLKPEIIWAEGDAAGIGPQAGNVERGIYQLAIVTPPNTGPSKLNELRGALREHFKRGTSLTYNGLTITVRKAYPGPSMLSVAFYSYTDN
jgi:hypothetical protein